MPLRAIDASTLDELYDDLCAEGGTNDKDGNPKPLSPSTVAAVHRILRRALGDAVKRDLLRTNPANDATVPRSVGTGERQSWTAEELRTFLEHVADDRLAAMWTLVATTGLRRGELCGQKWIDIDLDAGGMVVRRSRVPIRGNVVETSPKSGKERGVALAAATVAALRAHRKRQLEERLAWGEAWTDTGYVFTKEDPEPLWPDWVTRAFTDHVRAAGLRPIVLHGIRHTYITLGLKAGVPVNVMQARAGHANVQTTLSYAHVQHGMQEQAADTVERLIFGDSQKTS
jgi:integrase